MDDLFGLPEKNYYFAAPVDLDNDRKILFVRVKQKENKNKRFYVHEVFTKDEIKNALPLEQEMIKRKSGSPNVQTATPDFVPARKQADLYRSILKDFISINPAL